MKTAQDYMNDPRLAGDPEMAGALEPVREIHAMRLKLRDETAGMTVAERADFLNREAEAFLAPMGRALRRDLTIDLFHNP